MRCSLTASIFFLNGLVQRPWVSSWDKNVTDPWLFMGAPTTTERFDETFPTRSLVHRVGSPTRMTFLVDRWSRKKTRILWHPTVFLFVSADHQHYSYFLVKILKETGRQASSQSFHLNCQFWCPSLPSNCGKTFFNFHLCESLQKDRGNAPQHPRRVHMVHAMKVKVKWVLVRGNPSECVLVYVGWIYMLLTSIYVVVSSPCPEVNWFKTCFYMFCLPSCTTKSKKIARLPCIGS